ncbi:MAG: hypothetical protein JO004_04510 [Methylobacteriaceae bacterium]|nr:hypothetical protein [Methylobacteriaceae bacterium]
MAHPALPFQPFRQALYSPIELLAGIDPLHPESLTRTRDFAIFRYWVKQGRYKPQYFDGMMQALHDNSISQCVGRLVAGRKVVGIMGGHADERGTNDWNAVAMLARRLTKAGYFVASGGGPGMMEAAHVGAFHARVSDGEFHGSLKRLAAEDVAKFPDDAGRLLDREGNVDANVRLKLFNWLAPVLTIRKDISSAGESLGIPTWRYGHEPTSVFATHIAKYFENSVREDGLLSIARDGVVYARGGAGTLQEIFQDAVFNAYFDDDLPPSPMIFFGRDHWEKMAVLPVLKALFEGNFERFVSITDDADAVIATLDAFAATIRDRARAPRAGLALSNPILGIDRLEPEGGDEWVI